MTQPRQIGLVVHPSRALDRVLREISTWADARGTGVGQVRIEGQNRRVAEPVEAEACDLLIALGGDGTTLVALHAGAARARPVLGVACGSVGALTSVSAERLGWALEQVAADEWTAQQLPGLEVGWGSAGGGVAINDLVVVRDGPGQVIVSITVDEVLYARVAGDGVVVASPLGSSAYAMAAGGPILAPGVEGLTVTPLADHGGSCPPLVMGPESRLELAIDPGYGGVRHEIDGRRATVEGSRLSVVRRAAYATLVRLAGEEPRLAGLRRRGLVLDSPRVLVRDARPGYYTF